jgi:hypothetical protein
MSALTATLGPLVRLLSALALVSSLLLATGLSLLA